MVSQERGAFTGAIAPRTDRLELSIVGSISVDESRRAPARVQVAFPPLQEGESECVGGTETIRTDARGIAHHQFDLPSAMERGRFRGDLA
jgi:DNA-binding NtrC family response regulator